MNRIIAVDFDGTCVRHEYPQVGADVPHAVRVLRRLNEEKIKIIVWTMRAGKYLDEDARRWFEERNIEIWAYNDNPQQKSWTDSRKCYAHAYIDDAAVGCPLIDPADGGRPFVDWIKIETLLEAEDFLPPAAKPSAG